MRAAARLTGIGGHLPGTPVDNDHFATTLATSDEWIRSRTGIRQRHFAAPGTAAVDLALPAARDALASAGVCAGGLDAIIVATSTPDQVMPATACLLQQALGAPGVAAFDLNAACSGFVYALGVAHGLVVAAGHRNVLVVGVELYSRILDFQDRATCVLFGDGAGAAVVSAAATPGILASDLHADGTHHAAIRVPARISANALEGQALFAMDGGKVYRLAVQAIVDSAIATCTKGDTSPAAVDWFVIHQANLRIIDAAAQRLAIREEAVVRTVDRHANTSAASIPLALSTVWERVRPGDLVLLTAVGAGLTWGSVLLRR